MVVDAIWVYPFKSLHGIELSSAEVLKNGALQNDRRWAFFLENGKTLNAKKSVAYQTLTHKIDLEKSTLAINETIFQFNNVPEIEKAVGSNLGFKVVLRQNEQGGFPDDAVLDGPTVVLKETLTLLAKELGFSYVEAIRRFRPNIIVSGAEAFSEDFWVGKKIGIEGNVFEARGICNRCIVPSRNSITGNYDDGFKKRFVDARMVNALWRSDNVNEHYYKLCINTQMLKTSGKAINNSSSVTLL